VKPVKLVIDASVLLKAYFPEEDSHRQAQILLGDHAWGSLELAAPPLLRYEITNTCLVASRRGRLSSAKAREVAREMLAVIDLMVIEEPPFEEVLILSEKFGTSGYDGAYLALAGKFKIPLVTGDKRLYKAARGSPLCKTIWIGDYRSPYQAKAKK
jgi:predicted nucleic acid-binding protein